MDYEAPTQERAARNVAALMESRGTSLLGLATSTGIPRTTLRRSIEADRPFTLAELDKVARHFGVKATSLLREHTERSKRSAA